MYIHKAPFPSPREGRKGPQVVESKAVKTAKIEEEIDLITEPVVEEAKEVEETPEEILDGNS
jgi:hypothetical protein